MRAICLTLVFIVNLQLVQAQDLINCGKDLIIVSLMDYGFDTIPESEMIIIDSTDYIVAKFNNNHCSRLEYHLLNEEDSFFQFCDSIYFTTECHECLNSVLDDFFESTGKKWKQDGNSIFYSLKGHGKSIIYGNPRIVTYSIEKLEIVPESDHSSPQFFVHHIEVSDLEFKRIKQLKNYR